jgi:hypothetical protein
MPAGQIPYADENSGSHWARGYDGVEWVKFLSPARCAAGNSQRETPRTLPRSESSAQLKPAKSRRTVSADSAPRPAQRQIRVVFLAVLPIGLASTGCRRQANRSYSVRWNGAQPRALQARGVAGARVAQDTGARLKVATAAESNSDALLWSSPAQDRRAHGKRQRAPDAFVP